MRGDEMGTLDHMGTLEPKGEAPYGLPAVQQQPSAYKTGDRIRVRFAVSFGGGVHVELSKDQAVHLLAQIKKALE
jgi:hypothetical protein